MTNRERELYERYQTLTALIGALLHELRNPLHSATLLVEAMGMKGADVAQLRTKLKGQFAKLEAICSEAGQPIKELAIEPELATVEVDPILARAAATAKRADAEADVSVEGDPNARAVADPILLERGLSELLLRAVDPPIGASASHVVVRIVATGAEVRLTVEDDGPPLDEATRRSPFAITSGGIRLATARAVVTLAGGSMRLERSDVEGTRFVVILPGA